MESRFIAYRKRKNASHESLVRLCEAQRKKLEKQEWRITYLESELEASHSYRSTISMLRDEIKELEKKTPANYYAMELDLSEERRARSKVEEELRQLRKLIREGKI